MELREEELDKILAGNSQGMSDEYALNNPDLFRTKQIEDLKREKEKLEALNNPDLLENGISRSR